MQSHIFWSDIDNPAGSFPLQAEDLAGLTLQGGSLFAGEDDWDDDDEDLGWEDDDEDEEEDEGWEDEGEEEDEGWEDDDDDIDWGDDDDDDDW
jgi:hypothetical protein